MIKIDVSEDHHYYKIVILPNADKDVWQEDRKKVLDLPEREGQWIKEGDVQKFSHYLVPRTDVEEIMRRWTAEDILGSKAFLSDIKTWNRVNREIDPNKSIPESDINLPDGIELKDHQIPYVCVDPRKKRTLIHAGTGAGKTFCTLARAHVLGAKRVIVFTVRAVADDWARELESFFGEPPVYYKGTPAQRKKLLTRCETAKCIIATYTTGSELADLEDFPDALILDEADLALSNPRTNSSTGMDRIFDRSWNSSVQIATATPVRQIPSSVWNLFRWIHPFLSGSATAFQMRYEVSLRTVERKNFYRDKNGNLQSKVTKERAQIQLHNRKRLEKKLAACAVEVVFAASFKEIERFVECPMTPRQKQAFDDLKKDLKTNFGPRTFKIQNERAKVVRLKQVAEGLAHFDEDGSIWEESGKLHWLRRKLSKVDHKVVIWSLFRLFPLIIFKEFKDRCVIWHGDLTDRERFMTKAAFAGVSNDSERQQYDLWRAEHVANKKKARAAGKEPSILRFPKEPGTAQFFTGTIADKTARGMNLQTCYHQIFLSTSSSNASMIQTRGRLLRIGQKSKIVYSDYLISDEFEKRWIERLHQQRSDAKLSAAGSEQLSSEEVNALLKLL